MTILELFQQQMDTNGYAYWAKNTNYLSEDFDKDSMFYIPEYAEDITDCFTYNRLLILCEDWMLDNQWYHIETNFTAEQLLWSMIDTMTWESPYTWLEQLKNYDHE